VLIAGAVAISAAIFEKKLATSGFTIYASVIANCIKIILPFALIGALIFFVMHNPLL
jgi:hypothetical protein